VGGHRPRLRARRQQVVLSDDDFAAAPERTRTIEIEQLVDFDAIHPAHFNHPLLPNAGLRIGGRHARLPAVRDAMAGAQEVAIGRVALRSKEYLVAVRVAVRERDGLLSLTTMLFADEIRDPTRSSRCPRDAREPRGAGGEPSDQGDRRDDARLRPHSLPGLSP
jgi:non-homologous end joining protein Ku